MNGGYLSIVLISMVLVLLVSGWKDILFAGLPSRWMVFFLLVWPFLSNLYIVQEGISIQVFVPFLLMASFAATARVDSAAHALRAWSGALLSGCLVFLMWESSRLNILPDYESYFGHLALVLALVAVVLSRNLFFQFISISAGMIIGEGAVLWIHGIQMEHWIVGGAAFADQWWYALFAARAATAVAAQSVRLANGARKHWIERRSRQQNG